MQIIELSKKTVNVPKGALIRVELNEKIGSITLKDTDNEITINMESIDFEYFFNKMRKERLSLLQSIRKKKYGNKNKD